jgi:hypothetical protein
MVLSRFLVVTRSVLVMLGKFCDGRSYKWLVTIYQNDGVPSDHNCTLRRIFVWQTAGRGSLRDDSTIRWVPAVADDIAEGTVHVPAAVVVEKEALLTEPLHEETDPGALGADHLGERFLAMLRKSRLRTTVFLAVGQ